MPEPRKSVQKMRPYSPPTGGRHHKVRLDFNENTIGCSPRVRSCLIEALQSGELLAAYPDYELADVRQELARFFGVADAEMVLTNGTDEAIQLLVNTYVEPGDQVVVMSPSYAMYRFYAEVAAAEILEVGFDASDAAQSPRTLAFNVDRLLKVLTGRTKAIFIANPNNPTGTAVPMGEIERLLARAPQACILVDEAYFEFHGKTALPLIRRYDNLFVSRTFSKAYGLAGLRIGALMSQEKNASALRKAQSPYSVNTLAALAARTAIDDQQYVASYVANAQEGKRIIEQAFNRLGIPYWESQANFVLFDAGGALADIYLEECREAGILIRDRRHEIPGALRVTAGTPEQARQFVRLMEGLNEKR